jgi:hypothetical protein
VSKENAEWSEWMTPAVDDDLWVPEDGEHVFWSEITYAGEGMNFWQVQTLPADDGTHPAVKTLEVSTVDATYGANDPRPSVNDGMAQTSEAPQAVPRPAVVTRSGWGCPDGQGSRVDPAYRYATHMVVHHTAGPGTLRSSEETWADRVRAIWSFHTYTRGWGDIGYNYLIAPDGTIYEGRGGGDNAVGFHDTANYGSMGVSLIGTYETISPAPAMQDSLVSLLAWKANQNDIAPLGQSAYYGCSISRYCNAYTPDGVLDNILGHRHVTPNYTSCPGDQMVALLPSIRERVRQRVLEGGEKEEQPDNGDLVIDELETSFSKSQANWYRAACGDAGHTFYTYATDSADESTNNGTWQPVAPLDGRYRVYAHIPQGCGLSSPPYASTQARYQVHSADGVAEVVVDHNTAEEWVDLGSYTFHAESEKFVTLNDLTGEPYSDRRILFFDSIKWVPDTEPVVEGSVELLDVAYDRTTLAAGELLEVRFTVKNSTTQTLETQNPQADMLPDGSFSQSGGYVYKETECMLGDETHSYPAYPKEIDRFRVTLGAVERTPDCAGAVGGYPWRWGLNGVVQPGEVRTITGYVQFDQPGQVTVQAGLIEEYVKYHAQSVFTETITITQEQQAPAAVSFDDSLQPLAHAYHLAEVPDNLLVRSMDATPARRGDYVGSFAWNGSTLEWGEDGPLGVRENVLLEQVRVITVPLTAEYTFRITSNGNAWLWVDGNLVVSRNGLSSPPDMQRDAFGTISLGAGKHVLSFKYFQLSDVAVAGYAMQMPGENTFIAPPDGLSTTPPAAGTVFTTAPLLTLAGDDQGGSGVAAIRYSWDGQSWVEEPVVQVQPNGVSAITLGPLDDGAYHLRYQVVDTVGNTSPMQNLIFSVDAEPEPTPTPPTITPTMVVTPTITPTTVVTPTITPTTVVSPTSSPTPSSTPSSTPSPTIKPSPQPIPTDHRVFLPMISR